MPSTAGSQELSAEGAKLSSPAAVDVQDLSGDSWCIAVLLGNGSITQITPINKWIALWDNSLAIAA